MFFIADESSQAMEIGGHVREELGKRLDLIDSLSLNFVGLLIFQCMN